MRVEIIFQKPRTMHLAPPVLKVALGLASTTTDVSGPSP